MCKVRCNGLTTVTFGFVDYFSLNNSGHHYVYASSEHGRRIHRSTSNNSRDDPECITNPDELHCSTLKFILTNIIVQEMFWINTIYMDNYFPAELEIIYLPVLRTNVTQSIVLTCMTACNLQFDIAILSGHFCSKLVLQVANVTLENSMIAVGNMNTTFVNVEFFNSTVTDWPDPGDDFGHVELHFSKVKFSGQLSTNSASGIFFHETFVATIFVKESSLSNADITINVQQLLFYSDDMSFVDSRVDVYVDMFCFSTFQSSSFTGFSQNHPSLVTVSFAGNNLKLHLEDTLFEGTRGLMIIKQDSGLLASGMQISALNCIFNNNRKVGSGGAVEIIFFAPDSALADMSNVFRVKSSVFIGNRADRLGAETSQGGGISIQGFSSISRCHSLLFEVETSTFTNNVAADGGGGLSLSGSCLVTTIQTSTFSVNETAFDSPKGAFVLASTSISITSSEFARIIPRRSPSLVELEMSPKSAIQQLGITVKCSAWYQVLFESKFVDKQAKEAKVTCSACSPQYYIPSDGEFFVSFLINDEIASVQSLNLDTMEQSCISCPTGANCPGNDVIASPNFWGHRSGQEITMYQCPADYCCTADCLSYNQCSGHRTGVLCGSCEENYSLSLLSSQCIQANTCDAHWLWPLVILAAMMYVLWYTFKNDVFAIPVLVINRIKKRCSKPTQKSDVNYIDKGYFGIVTYFVQIKAVMAIAIQTDSSRVIDQLFQKIDSYIQIGLNFELTTLTNDTCALESVTPTKKAIFKILFLVGMFIAWCVLIFSTSLLKKFVIVLKPSVRKVKLFELKLISGLVEIVKYTYVGFTSIVFYSLVCTSVVGDQVWFYDGSVQCYSKWQITMIIFCLLFTMPYPLVIYQSMKLLKRQEISTQQFFAALVFPVPMLIVWGIKSMKKNQHCKNVGETLSKTEMAIYDGFRGGYTESQNGTQYWEAVVMLRRLLISMTILIPNALIQLFVCLVCCVAFLIHHLVKKPFVYHVSNKAETLSLSLLCGVAAINLVKASYLYADANPQGPQVKIMNNLELFETVFLVLLIGFVGFSEVALAVAARIQKAAAVKTKNIRVHSAVYPDTRSEQGHSVVTVYPLSRGEIELEATTHQRAELLSAFPEDNIQQICPDPNSLTIAAGTEENGTERITSGKRITTHQ